MVYDLYRALTGFLANSQQRRITTGGRTGLIGGTKRKRRDRGLVDLKELFLIAGFGERSQSQT